MTALILLLAGIAPFVSAEERQIRFDHPFATGTYNNSIMQDSDGFLWIGCYAGIIRYDGYKTKVYKAGPGRLSSSYAPCIFEDDEGLLWIGTMGGGLNVFNRKTDTFTHYKHDPGNPDSLNSDQFNWAPKTIAQDKEGLIWIGTQAGLNCFNRKTGKFASYRHDSTDVNSLSHDSVWTVRVGQNGLIWVGTEAGLDCFDKKKAAFTHYLHDPRKAESLGAGTVYAVLEDKRGTLWVGTGKGGLNRLNRKTRSFTHYRHDANDPGSLANDEVYSITEDSEGNLWLGRTYAVAAGLEKFDQNRNRFFHYRHDSQNPASISCDIVMSCFEDRTGILWVVCNTGAIDKYDKMAQRFTLYRNDPRNDKSLSSNVVVSIAEDRQKNIWLATQLGGLNKFDTKTHQFSVYKKSPGNPGGISDDYVFSMLEDSEANFWVATNDGMHGIFDRESGKFIKRYKNPYCDAVARGLLEDKLDHDILWFGTEAHGLFRFNKKDGSFKQYRHGPNAPSTLSLNNIIHLFQDPDGVLWVPTQGGGLNRFLRDTETFRHYKTNPNDPNTISGDIVNDCYVDSAGRFWVSTNDGGLNRFDKKAGTFKRYYEKHGFPTRSIKSILEDEKGNLWLGSDSGIIKFNIAKEQVVKIYTEQDGLQGNRFSLYAASALKTKNGQMWFTGLNGVNSFYPEKITHNTYQPPVYLTSISQGGEKIVSGLAIHQLRDVYLDWRHNFFEFECVALNFSKPEKNRYKYILEGWDRDWFHSGTKRFGRYSGLAGGDYTLKIMGCNNDGVWNDTPLAIRIHVGSPFWLTEWFYALCAAGVLFIFFIIHTNRIRQLRIKRLNRQKIILSETNTLLEREIGRRRDVEKALQKAHDELEQRVNVRTAELSESNQYLREEIIERIKAQKSLEKSKRKYRNLVENISDVLFLIDRNGIITYSSPAIESIIEYAPSEIIGHHFTEFVFKEDHRNVEHNFEKSISGHPESCEHRVVTKSGEIRWVKASGRPNLENDAVIGINQIMSDVTLTKLLQNELVRSERLAATGQLAASIVHEINSPLQGIVALLSVIRTSCQNDHNLLTNLDLIRDALRNIRNIVNNLLDLNRPGKNKKQWIDINVVIEKTIALLRHHLKKNRIRLKFNPSPILPEIEASPQQLGQVFMNLLNNAVEAIRSESDTAGEITVTTSLKGDEFIVTVADTGPGICENSLLNIFEPFYTCNKKMGMGVGLSICNNIIKDHNGTIFAQNSPEGGAVFTITLPLNL